MIEVAAQMRALPGQQYCGDQTAHWQLSSAEHLVGLVDGIGHGKLAYEAATKCLSVIEHYRVNCLIDIMRRCNQALRSTRGVALALCTINTQAGQLEFVGVGNIRTSVWGTKKYQLNSKMGILGHEAGLQLSSHTVDFSVGQTLLCMSSDGVHDELSLQQYRRKSLYPNLDSVVDELLTQWGKPADDAAILVVR